MSVESSPFRYREDPEKEPRETLRIRSNQIDPSVRFGQNEAFWVYEMAAASGSEDLRSRFERVRDAVNTALSQRQEEGLVPAGEYINIEAAVSALLAKVERS